MFLDKKGRPAGFMPLQKGRLREIERAAKLGAKPQYHRLHSCPASGLREAWEILYVRRQTEGVRRWEKWGVLCPKHGAVCSTGLKVRRRRMPKSWRSPVRNMERFAELSGSA